MVKHLPTMQVTWVQSLGWEDLLEKEMATHSNILAWKIPWVEEPGRLQSMELHHRKLMNLMTSTTALSNSVKLWAKPCRATQDGWVMVESSDKMWSTGEENGKPLQYSCFENPMNSMKRQKDRTLKDELPRLVGAQYATGDQWRNNSRKKKDKEPKQKQHPVVDVTGDGNKVQCCKEQYCIGTWNVRSMNQGKLEVVKQEMARVNTDILGISELKWTGMGEFNSNDHYIYYCGQESLRRNGGAIMVNKKSVKCRTWMQSQKWQNNLFLSKANHSISEQSKSVPQPAILKKLKLNGSMKTYKTF